MLILEWAIAIICSLLLLAAAAAMLVLAHDPHANVMRRAIRRRPDDHE
jgi:hypothetical protein